MGRPRATIAPRNGERYDCSQCPGYCCSYRLIPVTARDIGRLAAHLGMPAEAAEAKLTRIVDGERSMRTRRDRIYPSICMLFDQEKRCCTVYEARPEICRKHPGGRRCGYFDALMRERELRGDETFVLPS